MTDRSTISRARILKAAEKLYYENGYDNTSFEQIAAECGITKPLITYHFKSKHLLAGTVYKNTLDRFAGIFVEAIHENVPKMNEVSIIIACACAYVQYYKTDEKAKRFFLELIQCASIEDLGDLEDHYRITNQRIGTNFPEDRVHLIYIASNYALHGLIKHYLMDDIRGSDIDFLFYFATIWLHDFNLTEKDILKYAWDAVSIFDTIKVVYGNHFNISINTIKTDP